MGGATKFPESFKLDPVLFYNAIVKSTDDYIYIIDIKKDTALVSENLQRDFNLPVCLVQGLVSLFGALIHKRDKERFFNSVQRVVEGRTDELNEECQIRNRNKEYVWVICRGWLQRDEEGRAKIFAGMITNLSNRGRVDYVTGLFMQRECEREVDTMIEQKLQPSGILLLGLDNFSNVNALRGHKFGDAVLRQFAQDTQNLLPEKGSIYRFDGDEFIVICKNMSCSGVLSLYHEIAGYCRQRRKLDHTAYYCTVSGGIAMIGKDGMNGSEIISCAARALEVSKQRGKNTCTIYNSEFTYTKMRSLKIADRIRSCILNEMEGFSLVYQPILGTSSQRIVGAEALLRWSEVLLGAVSPVEFIPLLETSGLILSVGKWVLKNAVKKCKEWTMYEPEFVMHINCSYLQLLDSSFIGYVKEEIEKYELDPKHIVLELTESRFVTDQEGLKRCFEELRKLNIRLAMDDFGTGYSSLAILSRTPADIVKIDRGFITSIGDQAHAFNRSFIGAVIQLCHSVGINVCVEGVEEQDELDTVVSLKADSIQGFYISKPIEEDEFKKRFWIMPEPV